MEGATTPAGCLPERPWCALALTSVLCNPLLLNLSEPSFPCLRHRGHPTSKSGDNTRQELRAGPRTKLS